MLPRTCTLDCSSCSTSNCSWNSRIYIQAYQIAGISTCYNLQDNLTSLLNNWKEKKKKENIIEPSSPSLTIILHLIAVLVAAILSSSNQSSPYPIAFYTIRKNIIITCKDLTVFQKCKNWVNPYWWCQKFLLKPHQTTSFLIWIYELRTKSS